MLGRSRTGYREPMRSMKLLVAGGALLAAVAVSLAACSGPGGTPR
jgi:hypothetical protein